ncbi:polyphosphate glucokinase [Arthrobacter sp. V4I6]|uniref:polyphosphate--glucose phosphotransferase n=1 Tax=unclassified Arthrobacter TaxID=235627 RepID=UPI00277F188D|nr:MULTISPECIES: ROK family protein [unclassified Arthrobacter]MDQ0822266.1 polyphosphate glucokinase [Arthrobacter sp. V1I7]MDQ0851903.1 polyphosphate glucokinase [Arthrobacter sp. V4I6]
MASNTAKTGPIIGIDIGGTGVKGGIVNVEEGEVRGSCLRFATPQPANPDSVGDVVSQIVDELVTGNEDLDRTSTVGVTFPGIVQHGISRSAANVDKAFLNFDINSFFTERLRRRVAVINDADAAGLAEARCGAGKGTNGTVLVITLGTGIGSALIFDGNLVPNAELGHLSIDGFDAEIRASAVARECDRLTWEEYSVRLQRYFSELEFIFSPELIIVGGGISERTDEYLPLLRLRTPITPAKLRNEAGIVGAAIQAASTT